MSTHQITRADVVAAAARIHADHAVVIKFGDVRLTVESTPSGPRYIFWHVGRVGQHSIAAEATITSRARLTAHFAGFVGVHLRADDPAIVERA
jgi:hypothetical protein